VHLYCIPTTIGTEVYFSKPFMYDKFQLDWSTYSHLMVKNAKCAKRSKKNKIKFFLLISKDWLNLLQIRYVGRLHRGHLYRKFGWILIRNLGAENQVYHLPVNIHKMWHDNFLGHMIHHHVSWVSEYKVHTVHC